MLNQLPATTGTSVTTDAVEVAEVARTVRRGWRAVIGFTVLGAAMALALLLFAPPRFTGRASVLIRSASADAGGGLLGKLTGMGGISDLGGLGAAAALETELQVLRSRSTVERVVDSLQLQFRVRKPVALPSSKVVAASTLKPSFEARTYGFTRTANGSYAVAGSDVASEMAPGKPVTLDVGSVTFASSGLPEAFTITVYDREESTARFLKRLSAKKAGGDVAAVAYSAYDRETAEAAPNTLIAFYLEDRKTVDRGTNSRRVEYLTREFDTVAAELSATERELRRVQERTGILDEKINGQVELESNSQLRKSLIDLEVESGAINRLLAQLDSGKLQPQQLAAHPAFLRGSALSPSISQLGELQAQRVRLLERRTESDPEMIALDQSIKAHEATVVSTARSYASTLKQQVAGLRHQIDSVQRTLIAMPAAIEGGGRLQRDVMRLSQILAAVQAQLVQARLGAIGEGGLVRQLDFAFEPRKKSFPDPWITMGVGIFGGLFVGTVAALILGWFGRWLRDPLEIERATGLVAQRLSPDTPLLMGGTVSPRTVLVVPINDQARAGLVAERLARTAESRAMNPTVLDLTRTVASNGNGSEHKAISTVIDQLEQQHGMVVVQLPGLSHEATVAAMRENRPVLLVAPPGRVDRAQLENALQTLRRLQVPVAGIVISETAPAMRSPVA